MTNSSYKPFDLQAAIAGKPIVRRDGMSVKFVTYHEGVTDGYPVVVIVDGTLNAYMADGSAYDNGEDDLDIFMATEKKKVWINVWKNKLEELAVTVNYSEEEDEKDKTYSLGCTLIDSFTKEYDI